jgi:hypothetical protein
MLDCYKVLSYERSISTGALVGHYCQEFKSLPLHYFINSIVDIIDSFNFLEQLFENLKMPLLGYIHP